MTDFHLHPRLAADCSIVADATLSHLLLMNDAHYPWFILVPRRADLREIYELNVTDQQQLLAESSALGRALMQAYAGDKLNIGALGNMVPQLHLHHIVRHRGDAAWPAPVWGQHPPLAYTAEQRVVRLAVLRPLLADWHWL